MIDPRELRKITAFADLEDDDLRWLAERAEIRTFAPGDALMVEGDATVEMIALLEGEIVWRKEKGTPDGLVITARGGDVTGLLPHSRMTHTPVTLRAVLPTRTANFPKAIFPEMLERMPALQARLASIMVDRSREFTRQGEQREKLISLGKLSAGLAHELNNPTAAIQQRAEALRRRLDGFTALALGTLQPYTAAALQAHARTAVAAEAGGSPRILDALERADAEDALASWLDSRGLPGAWAAAETFVAAGLAPADLERVVADVPDAAVAASLQWLEADLAMRRLVEDIADASRRVVELIAAVKAYSNMDRAPRNRDIDLHEGIRSTLTMLGHKLRSKDIVLRTEFGADTPHVSGNPGELNQVWTNLLDNAIDAVATGGEIVVRTSGGAGSAVVEVCDDGIGIPEENRQRIFEPFFTTKDVGQGSGLGLDVVHRIVERHLGQVNVDSVPGHTCFAVRLPATEPTSDAGGGAAP
jgi:signal transduction histidine kinase